MTILRASDIYSTRTRRGILPVGRTHFFEVIAPRLVRVSLGEKAFGYTERSLQNMIAEGVKTAAKRTHKNGIA
jgi:hypothetical protein